MMDVLPKKTGPDPWTVSVGGVALVNAPEFPKSGQGGHVTLELWKCYLDSCASYHMFFIKEFLSII